ncbi:MAG: hypothetical protein AB7G54_11260 [Methyloceanibacter sp.]
MQNIVRGIACLLIATSVLATNSYGQKLPPEAKAKIEAAAKLEAKNRARALAKVQKGKRDDLAYEHCFDTCLSENDCSQQDFSAYAAFPMGESMAYAACMAGWEAGCAAGCWDLKP